MSAHPDVATAVQFAVASAAAALAAAVAAAVRRKEGFICCNCSRNTTYPACTNNACKQHFKLLFYQTYGHMITAAAAAASAIHVLSAAAAE